MSQAVPVAAYATETRMLASEGDGAGESQDTLATQPKLVGVSSEGPISPHEAMGHDTHDADTLIF